MPSKEDGRNYKNLTLRLPDEYHQQLAWQAGRGALTLNAHITNIIHRHLLESGFAPDVIKSLSGRLFQVEVEPISQSRSTSYFCSRFDVNEYHPLYTKRRAHYIIGLANRIAGEVDPYGVVRAVGLALLNFYNRRGFEIDQIAWQNLASDPPSPHPTIQDNWRYIGPDITKSPEQFMIALSRNHWTDDRLIATGQSQDIRCKLRTEEDLYR